MNRNLRYGNPLRYALVGMKHRGTEDLVKTLPNDEPLTLIREPGNAFDPKAVQVWARGRMLGYVSSKQNEQLAKFIDINGKLVTVFEAPPNAEVALDGSLPADTAVVTKSGLSISAKLHVGNNSWPLVEL